MVRLVRLVLCDFATLCSMQRSALDLAADAPSVGDIVRSAEVACFIVWQELMERI